jgi:signal transduction histidine kinase
MSLSRNLIYNKIHANHRRIKLILVSILAFCLIVASLTFSVLSATKPYMGISLSLDNQGWVVMDLESSGIASNTGIREGDRPVEINGQPADIFLEKYREYGYVHWIMIHSIILIDDNGHMNSVNLENYSPTFQSRIELIGWLFVSILFWITGLFVFFKKPDNFAALLLCLCSLCFGLASGANTVAESVIIQMVPIAVIATIIGPWILLHFFLALPEERTWARNNPLVYLIYLPALITIILFFLIGYADGQPLPGFRTIRLVEYGVVFLLIVGVAILNLLLASSVRTRQQMKIVLMGCLAGLIPFLALSIFPATMYNIIPSGFNVVFLGLIPIGMGYAVITKKLMDIDIIIRRTLIYGIITLVMAVKLSVAFFLVLTFQESLGILEDILIAIALSIITALLFGPIRKRTELLVDKFFYKDRYDYGQIIQGLSTSLNSVNDLTEISRLVVGTAVNTLNLAGGCLFIKTRSNSYQVNAAQGTFIDKKRQNELLTLVSHHNQAIEFPNTSSTVASDLAYLIPLVALNEEIGFLCVSQKVSRQNFSSDDIFLLQGIALAAAIELHSAMLARDVSIRDTFVSVASHELRTPLTPIVGYADLLLNRNPPEATKRQWIKRIFDNSQRLSTMVDDLLNVSRIQSGRIKLTLEKVRPSEVLEETILFTKEYADKHEFIVEIEPDLPVVLIDRDKLGQVVGNLLSNAIKYSPEGGRITLGIYHDSENHHIIISVNDQGIGIGPEDKDSIFTTFHRIRRPETQNIRGSGLGLYIAKEWTEAMGGKIWLESEINRGSTFFVAIPTQASISLKDKSFTQSTGS